MNSDIVSRDNSRTVEGTIIAQTNQAQAQAQQSASENTSASGRPLSHSNSPFSWRRSPAQLPPSSTLPSPSQALINPPRFPIAPQANLEHSPSKRLLNFHSRNKPGVQTIPHFSILPSSISTFLLVNDNKHEVLRLIDTQLSQ